MDGQSDEKSDTWGLDPYDQRVKLTEPRRVGRPSITKTIKRTQDSSGVVVLEVRDRRSRSESSGDKTKACDQSASEPDGTASQAGCNPLSDCQLTGGR